MKKLHVRRAASLAVLVSLAACSTGSPPLPAMRSDVILRALGDSGAGKISHIVYIVQENRSFNNLFMGFPGALTSTTGKNSSGETITLQPISLADQYTIDHSAQAMFAACDGTGRLPGTKCKNDGFNNESSYGGPQNPEYVYAPRNETRPYWDMARQYVLADHMFQSQLDESFVAHQYIIAAQADSAVDLPDGLWGCGGGKYDVVATITKDRDPNGPNEPACFDYQTLGDELDNAGLTWKFYTSKYGSASSDGGAYWSSYQAVHHIYKGPDWSKDIVTPQRDFIKDVANGKLSNFTWITPECSFSDHVNCGGGYGPSWVAALVNAVGESQFWDSTAIFVQWDDWGGLYDPVPPPYRGYDSVGFRVPLLIISPYARHGRVIHQQYETASVLRFAENLFGLGQLAAADKRANAPGNDAFNFNQNPRKFVKIKAPKGYKFFMHMKLDYRIPDYE